MPTLVLRASSVSTQLVLRRAYTLTGLTRNTAGVALPGCVVRLFRSSTDVKLTSMTSDATTAAYSFPVIDRGLHYVVARKNYTADSTTLTADLTTLTGDMTYLVGTTDPTLMGV